MLQNKYNIMYEKVRGLTPNLKLSFTNFIAIYSLIEKDEFVLFKDDYELFNLLKLIYNPNEIINILNIGRVSYYKYNKDRSILVVKRKLIELQNAFKVVMINE